MEDALWVGGMQMGCRWDVDGCRWGWSMGSNNWLSFVGENEFPQEFPPVDILGFETFPPSFQERFCGTDVLCTLLCALIYAPIF